MIWKKNDAPGDDPQGLPLLPLRDIIVFPYMVIPLFVGREKSIAALNRAMATDRRIFLVAQRDAKTNDPSEEQIFGLGTISEVSNLIRLPNGTVKVLVEGKRRARIKRYLSTDECFVVETEAVPERATDLSQVGELVEQVKRSFASYAKLEKRIAPDVVVNINKLREPGKLADYLAAQLKLKVGDKQKLLEMLDTRSRLAQILKFIQAEVDILEVQQKIRSRFKKQGDKKEREGGAPQMGDKDEFRNELQELESRINEKPLPDHTRERLTKELKKLRLMSPMSAEATVVRNYIDWVLMLPWLELTEEQLDLKRAQEILDRDHYALTKVKERILEYLAVSSLVKKMRGPILCLVGPPGVGKTSLARSIATATGRNFVRMSLGGVRDEAEIRGHRRTYIGALPGKLIQSLRKSASNNPVFLLDEIDKMSTDFRGDPASALLEVLDPEQNSEFNDHYLDLDYDLSEIMFIATANTISGIPRPLLDRLELITLSGYTEAEKLAISRRYLVPKQRKANGLTEDNITLRNSGLQTIIRRYTREAGVRELERQIAGVCRKVARKVVEDGPETAVKVGPRTVRKLLGVPRYRYGLADEQHEIGYTNGLAWTDVGGVLLAIEATVMQGSGKLILTGQQGDVMQESARAALSYIRSRCEMFDLSPNFYKEVDIHVHLPGAIKKDGPSAGITMCTTIISALLRVAVDREVAMTGEITLRGRVKAIGGLKEKVLAAHRGGIKRVLFPKENQPELANVPRKVRNALELIPVSHMDEVIQHALVGARTAEADSPAAEGTEAPPNPDPVGAIN